MILKAVNNIKPWAALLFGVVFGAIFVFFFFGSQDPKDELTKGHDLCKFVQDRRYQQRNQTAQRKWWEWACLLEQEWDKDLDYDCKDVRKAGNYETCFDKNVLPPPPCLVYSFGINNDFSFDDAMADYGCEVHSFDPSMGVDSYRRESGVHFHNLGLSTVDSDSFMPVVDGYTYNKGNLWKIKTLQSIKQMLGHEKRPLDILKMDIETYEWAVMDQVLKAGLMKSVRQLLIEWHIFPSDPVRSEFKQMYWTYLKLKYEGYRQFHSNSFQRYHSFLYFNSQFDNRLVNINFTK